MLSDWVRDAMRSGGLAALGGLILLENLVPPIPSELVLPLAGFYVGEGVLAFVPAVAAATLGSVLGAWLLYAVGRFGGRTALLRWGRVARLTEAKLDRADAWFDRHGPWIVLGGRLVPGVRSLVSLPAGAAQMPFGRFTLLTALGSGVWNTALIGAGWALGSNWERVGDLVGPASRVVLLLGVLGLCGLAVRMLVRRRRVW